MSSQGAALKYKERENWANLKTISTVINCWSLVTANTKHLYIIYATSAKRLRHWSNIVQMLHKCVVLAGSYPANIRQSVFVGRMLCHRLRRRPNIKPTQGQRLVLSGYTNM